MDTPYAELPEGEKQSDREEAERVLEIVFGEPEGKSMKHWLLRPAKQLPNDNNPWEPWLDQSFRFAVRAKTEAEAREQAQNLGEEITGSFILESETTPRLGKTEGK